MFAHAATRGGCGTACRPHLVLLSCLMAPAILSGSEYENLGGRSIVANRTADEEQSVPGRRLRRPEGVLRECATVAALVSAGRCGFG